MQNISFMQNPFLIKELRPQVLKSIETAQKLIVPVFPSETSLEIDFSGNVFAEVISKKTKMSKNAVYRCLINACQLLVQMLEWLQWYMFFV